MKHIGEYLKNLRIEKNITLEEAEDHTGIRVQYLQALEEGDFNKIPGDVFIKGFIRNYGNYLGADGNALVDAYIRSSETQAASAPAEPSPSDTIVIRSSRISSRSSLHRNRKGRKRLHPGKLLLLMRHSWKDRPKSRPS